MPVIDRDASIVGVLAVATDSPVDEESLAFVAAVTEELAPMIASGRLWDGRSTCAPRAPLRAETEPMVGALSLLAELTSLLASSLEYESTLPELTRLVATRVACGCVVDVVEPDGARRFSHAPPLGERAIARALGDLPSEIMRLGAPLAASVELRWLRSNDEDDPAERACRKLGVDWIVCVPVRGAKETLGALTIFGTDPNLALPVQVAVDLGSRIGMAVENGRAYRRAVTSIRNRDEALAMVSHDLKDPLGAILMNAARLLEETPEDDKPVCGRKQLEAILRSATRMMTLVRDLLDCAALDGGVISIRPDAWAPRALVDEAIETLSPIARHAGVVVTNELDANLSRVYADRDRVVQVLVNLVGNAIKFTHRGGRVRVRGETRDGEVVLRVADNGRGMNADALAHMFDRFWQAPTAPRGGSGLGLAICKALVEISGGRIWAESALGAGTTVTFTLPTPARALGADHGSNGVWRAR